MLGDLKNSRVIIAKGFLFLVTGFIAAGLLIADHPHVRTGLLLLITVWSFCRFYYFAFYVIQHYVDPTFHFSRLTSFVISTTRTADAQPLAGTSFSAAHFNCR